MPASAKPETPYERAYKLWFEALPAAEQNRLRKLGLDKPAPDSQRAGSGVGLSGDAAERKEASERWDPAEIDAEPGWERELADGFAKAMAWAAAGKTLVEIGQRLTIILHAWKPALLAGLQLEIERELADDFEEACADAGPSQLAGPVLEWISRGSSLSQWGQRFLAAIYVVSPGLIQAPTLARIGAQNNKTRQAVDKLVQDFRDTFGGIKSRAMRPEQNRITCRNAQLRKASRA